MKHQQLKQSISALKRSIRQSENAVLKTLQGNDIARQAFKNATREMKLARRKETGLAATDDTPWYENKFVEKLMNIGTSQLTARNDQKTLQIQLDTVVKQNAALDKQLSLQARLENAGRNVSQYGGNFLSELASSPTKIALLVGLGYMFFKNKKRPARRR